MEKLAQEDTAISPAKCFASHVTKPRQTALVLAASPGLAVASLMSDDDRMDTSGDDEEDEEEGQGINMMNFMFGNVDSHGELEGDFLDEV